MYNILNSFQNAQIFLKPFPHFVIDNALPNDLYKNLKNEFKIYEEYLYEINEKITQNTAYPLDATHPDFIRFPILNEFCQYHLTAKFAQDTLDIINKINNGYLNFLDNVQTNNFNLQANIRISTAATQKGTRQFNSHLDNSKELFAFLLYLKDENDSGGGDLIIHSVKNNVKKYLKGKSRIPDKYIIDEKIISYAPNRLVFFINGPLSIHSVSERNVSNICRNLINITGEFNNDMVTYDANNISADSIFSKHIRKIGANLGMKDIYGITNFTRAKKVDKKVMKV